MIKVENLTKTYTNKQVTTEALKSVSTEFPSKGLVFITGKSGCGKSTFLNLLGGCDKPTCGSIVVDGQDITQLNPDELNSFRFSYVGFIYQDFNLIQDLSVKENIGFPLKLDKKANYDEVDEIIKNLDINDCKDKKPNQLSGGQQQRVAIARALVKNSKIILADEPTGNLDKENTKIIFDLLKEVSKDKLVIVVTHDLESAKQYADYTIIMEDGRIIENNTVSDNAVGFYDVKKPSLRVGFLTKNSVKLFKTNFWKLFLSIILCVFSFGAMLTSFESYATSDEAIYANIMQKCEGLPAVLTKDGRNGDSFSNLRTIMNKHPSLDFHYLIFGGDSYRWTSYSPDGTNPLDLFDIYETTNYLTINASNTEFYKSKILYGSFVTDKPNEIVIPLTLANTMVKYDLYEPYPSTALLPINNYNDIIGKSVESPYNSAEKFKIIGIYDNRLFESMDELADLNSRVDDGDNFAYYEFRGLSDSFSDCSSNYLNVSLISESFVLDPDSISHIESRGVDNGNYLCITIDDYKNVKGLKKTLENDGQLVTYGDSIYEINIDLKKQTVNLFLYMSLILSFFSCLLLLNMYFGNISKSKKRIGIMRALGTRYKDLSLMYGIFGLIYGVIILIFSIPVYFAINYGMSYIGLNMNGFAIVGRKIFFSLSYFSFLPLLATFGVIIAVNLLALLISFTRLRKIPPIGVIKAN